MRYVANDSRYAAMKYNRCGKSGLKIPAIAFGLWNNFGYPDSYENARALVLRAFDLGITYFDIANNYGPPAGAAEEIFGKILKNDLKPHRDELIVTTKAGYCKWEGPYGDGGSKKYLTASLDQSLKNLGVDYVDVFFSHRLDQDTPLEETMSALDSLVRQGKALYIGLSAGYEGAQLAEALRILKRLGTPCTVHMIRYNMLFRQLEGGLQDLLRDEGIGSIAYSPLCEGLLTDRYLNGIPEDARGANGGGCMLPGFLTEKMLGKVRRLNRIAQERGQSTAQLALAWVLRGGRVTSALIGASRVGQIEKNVDTLKKLDLSRDELAQIDAILKD